MARVPFDITVHRISGIYIAEVSVQGNPIEVRGESADTVVDRAISRMQTFYDTQHAGIVDQVQTRTVMIETYDLPS